MKTIKWLLNLADGKPLIFSIAILLIAVLVLATAVKNRDAKMESCRKDMIIQQRYYELKLDSIASYYHQREILLNNEVKSSLEAIIEDYKDQLSEQKQLNDRIKSTIKKNRQIISK